MDPQHHGDQARLQTGEALVNPEQPRVIGEHGQCQQEYDQSTELVNSLLRWYRAPSSRLYLRLPFMFILPNIYMPDIATTWAEPNFSIANSVTFTVRMSVADVSEAVISSARRTHHAEMHGFVPATHSVLIHCLSPPPSPRLSPYPNSPLSLMCPLGPSLLPHTPLPACPPCPCHASLLSPGPHRIQIHPRPTLALR